MKEAIIKATYKYINEFMDEDSFLEEMERIISSGDIEEYKKSLTDLVKEGKALISEYKKGSIMRYKAIYDLLFSNQVYLDILESMTEKEAMLMITDYIYAPNRPKLDQKEFDAIVKEAINSGKDSKENCWRLAVNYQYDELNFDKIVEYLIQTRDSYYVVELVHTLFDVLNQDKIISSIIETRDRKFIGALLEDNFIDRTFSLEQIEKLEDYMAKGE